MIVPRICFICFCVVCIELVQGITISSRNFVVENDVQVKLTIKHLANFMAASYFVCAAECGKQSDCCSASYGNDSYCRLYKCCFPKTVNSTGGTHLRKRPYSVVRTPPKDCSELPSGSVSGVYTIHPTDTLQVDVYCDMDLEPGTGWTVIQRRIDGTVNFRVNWAGYKAGFGDLHTEYWIGNDILHAITTSKRHILRFDMTDFNGVGVYAEYDKFSVADESVDYQLTIGCYSGTAGDSASGYNGIKFTTLDRDNDNWTDNCATDWMKGAWWFITCGMLNPNGLYQPQGTFGFDTIHYFKFRGRESLASMSMKIKAL